MFSRMRETYQEQFLRAFKQAPWRKQTQSVAILAVIFIDIISKGGGVYSRKQKLIPLSAEVQAMLGTDAQELTPNQVINLILQMQVDLFWNGGIGTYVKSSLETNADANDPPNDDLRVSANELRCKIVGEGGNLGFTQAARIEYAMRGG